MKKTILYTGFFILSIIFFHCSKNSKEISTSLSDSGQLLQPKTGGSTLPNQVYINLSSGNQTEVARTSWDLGFYSGKDFRVILNGSINKIAAKQLQTNNINEIVEIDQNVTVGNFQDPNSATYVDNPSGNITKTVIAEVSANDDDNKVYLLNMGLEISESPAEPFKVNMIGKSRGWKKIRILRDGNGYKLHYANLEDTTYTEVSISKNNAFNFSFFSFNTNNTVNVEPQKDKWDLNLTTFTNIIPFPGNGYDISYFFPEFAIINTRAGVAAYQVFTADVGSYEAFVLGRVDYSKFESAIAKDQRAIGSDWRVTTTNPSSVKDDRFFILKDMSGNIFKIRFISLFNAVGERGNISFQYQLLK